MSKFHLYIISFVSVFLVMIFHELGHFIAGTTMGYDMKMSLNMVRFPDGASIDDRQQIIYYLAGPLFTLVLAFLALIIILIRKTEFLFPLLVSSFFLLGWTYLVSPGELQDEGFASLHFGWSPWVLPVVVWGLLILFVLMAQRSLYLKKITVIKVLLFCLLYYWALLGLDYLLFL